MFVSIAVSKIICPTCLQNVKNGWTFQEHLLDIGKTCIGQTEGKIQLKSCNIIKNSVA